MLFAFVVFGLAGATLIHLNFKNYQPLVKYYLFRPNGVSILPENSNDMANSIVMNQIVGTLVRIGNGGHISPYLASSYSVSDDRKTWDFTLRENLKCDDGEPISADHFVSGWKKLFRIYAKAGPLPPLSQITGWSEFLRGKELKGLSARGGNTINIRFESPQGPSLLEYFSMPYLGYYCSQNFEGKNWRSASQIISSGAYSLDGESHLPHVAKIRLRKNWPLASARAIQEVAFIFDDEHPNPDGPAIIQTSSLREIPKRTGFRLVLGPPDNILVIALDHTRFSRFFSDHNARISFRDTLEKLRGKRIFKSETVAPTQLFFPASSGLRLTAKAKPFNRRPHNPLSIFTSEIRTPSQQYALNLLTETLEELRWPFIVNYPGNAKFQVSDLYRRSIFDIRLLNVVSGSTADPWVIEMMFCSGMGVGLPDPRGKICESAEAAKHASVVTYKDLNIRFSDIIWNDAAVIPIYRSRTTWHFSEHLKVNDISGDMILPKFDSIEFRAQ